MDIVTKTSLSFPKKEGKVRDIYDMGGSLLLVATDRISAFDFVLPTGVPNKGKCLNQLSLFWFGMMGGIAKNHVITADVNEFPDGAREHEELDGRSVMVKKADPIRIECIVRGYLIGSGWRSYKESGEVCGITLPKGMVESQRFDEPLFTPTTKPETGHDENITFEQAKGMVGEETAELLREKSLEIFEKANSYASKRGIIIPDTKIEFGFLDGEMIIIDELLTPDSSRFWYAEDYSLGKEIKQMDKEYVRRYLMGTGWDRKPPVPGLPNDVVEETSRRYLEIYRALTGDDLGV